MYTGPTSRMSKRPLLDELVQVTREKQDAFKKFESGCNAVSALECSYKKLSQLPESLATAWLVLKFGVEVLGKVCRCESSLPQAITDAQRLELMSQICGMGKEELKPLR